MTYIALIILPLVLGSALLVSPRLDRLAHVIFAITLLVCPVLLLLSPFGSWALDWWPDFGIRFELGLDGLSYWLIWLLYGLAAVSLDQVQLDNVRSVRVSLGLMLVLVSGTTGVLLARDALWFFMFWEVVVLPFFFLVLQSKKATSQKAAMSYFLYAQGSGLVFLVALVALASVHHDQTGTWSFAMADLAKTETKGAVAVWIALGLMLPFLVKLPIVPLHGWIPLVFEAAPSSAVVVGIALKIGAYGALRFMVVAKESFLELAFFMIILGAITLIYGAIAAAAQTNPFRFLAFATISHMGLLVMALFSSNPWSDNGVVMMVLTQGLVLSGMVVLLARNHEGGIFNRDAKAGVLLICLTMALVGLPGFGPFVGEFLSLLGVYYSFGAALVFGVLGVALGAVYAVAFLQRWVFAPSLSSMPKSSSEVGYLVPLSLVMALLGLGFYPTPVLEMLDKTWQKPSLQGDGRSYE